MIKTVISLRDLKNMDFSRTFFKADLSWEYSTWLCYISKELSYAKWAAQLIKVYHLLIKFCSTIALNKLLTICLHNIG